MVTTLTSTHPAPARAYITPDEFKATPTGTDVGALVRGDQSASSAMLVTLIAQASSWADNLCDQVLAANVDVEAGIVPVSRDGLIRIHPRQTPLLEVQAVKAGADPSNMLDVDLSAAFVSSGQLYIPVGLSGASTPWVGSLRPSILSGSQVFAQWTYVAGWPNTVLAAAAAAGDSSLVVADGTGILPGLTTLPIYDNGGRLETVAVAGSYTLGATTVPLTAPLRFAHPTPGISVSALPPAVKQAVVLLTSALIHNRGSSALVMSSVRGAPERKQGTDSNLDDIVDLAAELLAPYRRVR